MTFQTLRAMVDAVEEWRNQLCFTDNNWKEVADLATHQVMAECRGNADPTQIREDLEYIFKYDS